MSSIDKYVKGEARECNPKVKVVNFGGYINGYIGRTKIFAIKDRYGYLDVSERSIIRDSINEYEEEERERQARYQANLENVRLAARSSLRSSLESAKRSLKDSHDRTKTVIQQRARSFYSEGALSEILGYNTKKFEERAVAIRAAFRSSLEKVDNDYNCQLDKIIKIEKSIKDDSSTEIFNQQKHNLGNVNVRLKNPNLQTREIDQLKNDIDTLKKSLSQLSNIKQELLSVQENESIGSCIRQTLKDIKEYSIDDVKDVEKLLELVKERLEQIQIQQSKQKTSERSAQIEILNAAINACILPREYVVEQPFDARNYRTAIIEAANKVLKEFSELDVAEYTTCSQQRISEALSMVQEIIDTGSGDENTLELLNNLSNEANQYKRDDQLQAANYRDYQNKVKELITRGVALDSIEKFDTTDYNEQKSRLNEQLLKLDLEEAASRTKTSFIMACRAMEGMGYKMLHYNMGGDYQSALACEAIYVKPGSDGVAWQIVASDCSITRRLVGIRRPNGMATSIERVQEVAQIMENTGEVEQFFNAYAQLGGGQVTTESYVDSNSNNSAAVISENGYFELTADGEKIFDSLVAEGDERARRTWGTRIASRQSASVTVKTLEESNLRKRQGEDCVRKYRAKRN